MVYWFGVINMLNIHSILEKVAQQNNVSLEEVQNEIQISIKAAMSNPDLQIQSEWASVPKEKEEPTPEELIAFLLQKILNIAESGKDHS